MRNLPLVDAETNEPIRECLVVPRYTLGGEIQLGDDREPTRFADSLIAIGKPFVYRPGEEFSLYEGETVSLLESWRRGPPGWLDGVTVIAAGYEAQWIWDLWGGLYEDWKMRPLPIPEAKREIEHIRALLTSRTIEDEDRMYWSLGGSEPIHVVFTDEERRLVLEFLDAALDQLDGDKPNP